MCCLKIIVLKESGASLDSTVVMLINYCHKILKALSGNNCAQ